MNLTVTMTLSRWMWQWHSLRHDECDSDTYSVTMNVTLSSLWCLRRTLLFSLTVNLTLTVNTCTVIDASSHWHQNWLRHWIKNSATTVQWLRHDEYKSDANFYCNTESITMNLTMPRSMWHGFHHDNSIFFLCLCIWHCLRHGLRHWLRLWLQDCL